MNQIEWLIFQVFAWIAVLLFVFLILFLIKFQNSEAIIKICYLLRERKYKIQKEHDQKRYMAMIYKRNSIERITSLLAVFFLVIIAFIVINQYVNFIVVTSDSMSPTLNRGDMVLVQSIDKTVNVGDVIKFQVPSRNLPVFHRVSEISNNGYITKGDISSVPDYWRVDDSQIQGKAVNFFGDLIVVPGVGEIFIVEPEYTKFGSKFSFISGLFNIFKILALIVFILALLSLSDNFVSN